MKVFYYLDIDLIEKISHPLAMTFLDKSDEPISLFSTCNKPALGACLGLPKATFDGKELYPDLISKAAI